MAKVHSWDIEVPCPMWVKTRETKKFESEDMKYPEVLIESDAMGLPEHIAETYEECAGQVRVVGYYNEGRTYGDPGDCYPPEGENEVYACDECKFDNWTSAQKEQFEERARND